ncbi:hypothetical protein D9758_017930 [Tetrapyrgos nigripes]|uniref:Uncharacterized protein n=1 Tax=Tetrapyrgos nigripes TaxID=182062 RepID=A0A8H5C2D5_9AGAR|nr:hypothetical protein D9758_017930 [Tetrapyrgos nigripes]
MYRANYLLSRLMQSDLALAKDYDICDILDVLADFILEFYTPPFGWDLLYRFPRLLLTANASPTAPAPSDVLCDEALQTKTYAPTGFAWDGYLSGIVFGVYWNCVLVG